MSPKKNVFLIKQFEQLKIVFHDYTFADRDWELLRVIQLR
jgi:hypothetical protein